MIQNNKKTLLYAGAIIVVSAIAYAIYQSKKSKLDLVDNARVTNDETPTPEVPKASPFTTFANKPLPSSIGYEFGSTTKL